MLVIEVQCCQNCQRHNWCSRHNQAKYQQFSSSLQTRLRTLQPDLSYTKNQPPPHFSRKTVFSCLGFPTQSYYDESKKQMAIFPRHGAFQIVVNGILIFSKLQSNIWPNLEKICLLVQEIKEDIRKGCDIQKYSINHRCNHQSEEKDKNIGSKDKKSVQFKISKRPKSNQFNCAPFSNKESYEQTYSKNKEKKRSKEIINKQKLKHQRQSEIDKKSIVKLRIKKNQSAHSINNLQSTHSINNNQQTIKIEQQFPNFIRKIQGNESCLMLNKRIQQKNQILREVKSQHLKSVGNKLKLQKKTRKLVIESNKNNPKKEQQALISCTGKGQQAENKQQRLFLKTPLNIQNSQQQKQDVQEISHSPIFATNTIQIQDYQSQKQINSIEPKRQMDKNCQQNELTESQNKNIDTVYIEEDNPFEYFSEVQLIREYWQKMAEEIILSIKIQLLKPKKECQQPLCEGKSSIDATQQKREEILVQQLTMNQKQENDHEIGRCVFPLQQIQQDISNPYNIREQFCEREQREQNQQLREQQNTQRSKIQVNTPTNQAKENTLTSYKSYSIEQTPCRIQELVQMKVQNKNSSVIQQNYFALDEIIPLENSNNIQQSIIKQQSKLFYQKLNNNVLNNTHFFNEENIRQLIQAIEQKSQNKFILNQQMNNSDDNIGIAFQLTKQQGFFQGKRQSNAKTQLLRLKILQEKNRQEELQYSVYSEDPKEKLLEPRQSKANSLKAMQYEQRMGHECCSNETIAEAESNIVEPTAAVDAQITAADMQKQPKESPSEQNRLVEKPTSSAKLEDCPQQEVSTHAQHQKEQRGSQVLNSKCELWVEQKEQQCNPITTQEREQQRIKSRKSEKSLLQKQNNPPSLKCLSSVTNAKISQCERVLPNKSQTSISLSSQIRSQLDCLYYDIQARIQSTLL